MEPHSPPSPRGRCWACGYRLDAIPSRRCPECGREFDPDNPRTMNMTGAVSAPARWLITHPLGWPLLALAALATLLLAATTRWPVGGLDFTCADVRHLLAPDQLLAFFRHPAGRMWTDLLFISGMCLWALLLLVLAMRTAARWHLARHYGPAMVRAPRRRSGLFLALMLLSALLVPVGADFRLASDWVGETLAARKSSAAGWVDYRQTFHAGLSPTREDNVLRCALRRLSPEGRIMAAGIVVETRAPRGLPLLLEACAHESHPDVRAALLMLIALYRAPATAPLLAAAIDDPAAPVRAAAADALGILHTPAYPIPFPTGWSPSPLFQPTIDGRPGPRIALDELMMYSITKDTTQPFRTSDDHLRDAPIDLPQQYRQKLERIMLGGGTQAEREAAARALVRWPAQGYSLRVAEWGVWFNDHGDLKLVQSVLDEIPPFVHRLGNPNAEFADRVNQISFIDKPIIHVTTSSPMAMDIGVEIMAGRPWYAYPRPDDFTLTADDFGGFMWVTNDDGSPKLDATGNPLMGKRGSSLVGLDPPATFARLQGTRQGYPGINPEHPKSGSISGHVGSKNDISSLGVRWQSIIASPELPAWATLAAVPADPKFAWWSRLRQVPAAYLVSQNEAERFLYYDGPTNLPAPVDVTLLPPQVTSVVENGAERLIWKSSPPNPQPRPAWGGLPRDPGSEQSKAFDRAGIFIRVRAGHATAVLLPSEDVPSARTFPTGTFTLPATFSEDAPALLLSLLTAAGLTKDEAQGLIDAWRPQFFQTEGDRVLVRFSSQDYDTLCPLHIQPAPTKLVRVGLLLTELPKP